MKRKVLSALLSVAMVATLLVGCGSSAETTGAPAEEAAPAEDAAEEAAPAEEAAWQCLQRICRDGIRMVPTWKSS